LEAVKGLKINSIRKVRLIKLKQKYFEMMQFLTWIIVVKVLENWREAFEGVRGPSVRRLVHDVAQDFFHPRRRLLFETVNVDGPEDKV
jgi:hypothetical protein